MRARVIAAILAAVLAIVGIGAVVAWAVSAQRTAYGNAELVKVYKATKPIAANSDAAVVTASVERVAIPKVAVADGAVTNLSQISGKRTTTELFPGEQLVTSRFSEQGSSDTTSIAVPDGMQQITVQLAAAPASAPILTAGSHVGLIASGAGPGEGATPESTMFASQVLVTKVTGDESKSDGQRLVTLAVTEEQALQIANAVNFASVTLTVQNDKTASNPGTRIGVESILP